MNASYIYAILLRLKQIIFHLPTIVVMTKLCLLEDKLVTQGTVRYGLDPLVFVSNINV
jgi:hypothetical protein